MKSGFSVRWTEQAVYDLENIIGYLVHQWSEKEVRNFVVLLDQRIALISTNPR
jgi:plasmid stabilization system protein ParE